MADNDQPTKPDTTEEARTALVADKKADMKADTAVQFDKLLKSNQDLYEEKRRMIEENEKLKREIANKQNQNTNTDENKELDAIKDLIDVNEKTGEKFLNPVKLAQKIEALTKQAEMPSKQVEELKSTLQNREVETQKSEAFTAYPTLDPKAKEFNSDFMRQVRGVMSDSVRFPGDYDGKTLSLKQAADWVAKKTGEKETKEDIKENLTTEPKKSNPQQTMDNNPDDLVRAVNATRRGNYDALAYRLETIKDSYTVKVQ